MRNTRYWNPCTRVGSLLALTGVLAYGVLVEGWRFNKPQVINNTSSDVNATYLHVVPQEEQRIVPQEEQGRIAAPETLVDEVVQAADQRARTRAIDTIVLHTTEGSFAGALNHLTSPDAPEVSAHYLISEEGRIVQLVHPSRTAFHVRGWNDRAIGIEITGHAHQRIAAHQIDATAQLVVSLLSQYNLPLASIRAHSELDPTRRRDPGQQNMDAILEQVRRYQR